jgi:hydroxymethylbilane synthase
MLARLEGGCQVPVGGLAVEGEGFLVRLSGLVADLDGRRVIRLAEAARVTGDSDARALGERLADRLLAAGAREVLDRVRAASLLPVPEAP